MFELSNEILRLVLEYTITHDLEGNTRSDESASWKERLARWEEKKASFKEDPMSQKTGNNSMAGWEEEAAKLKVKYARLEEEAIAGFGSQERAEPEGEDELEWGLEGLEGAKLR